MTEPRQLDLLERAIRALTRAEQVELRERLGEQCLWCGSPATVLCDGRISDLGSSLATCDAPICSSCSTSSEIHGHVCSRGRGRGCFELHDTIDYCPFCTDRRRSGTSRLLTLAEHVQQRREHAAAHASA